MRTWLASCRAGFLTVGLVILAELATRVVSFGPDAVVHPWRYQNERFFDTALGQPTTDPVLGYVLRPDLDTYFAGGRFRTNEHGFRGPSVTVDKPAGVVRIAVLGSSFSMGQGLDDDQTYPHELQRLVDERLVGRYQVLNLALSNHRPTEMFRAYELVADRFRPDVVLVEFFDEFLSVPAAPPMDPDRRAGWSAGSLADRYSFLYLAIRRFTSDEALGTWSRAAPRAPAFHVPPPADPTAAPGCVALQRFTADRRAEAVHVAIVRLARLSDLDGAPQDRFAGSRRCCVERAGCQTIDTMSWVRPRATSADRIFYGNDHPDAKVARLYAEAVFEQLVPVLVERGLEPGDAHARVEHTAISIGER